MSHRLYQRIKNIVEQISPQLDIFDKASLLSNSEKCIPINKSKILPKYQPITCNPNLRLYKYTKGQWFGRHVDESNTIEFPSTTSSLSSSSKHNKTSKFKLAIAEDLSLKDAQTEITVLFYLSSCRGGATVFHLPHERKSSSTSIAFTPEEGAVLLHVHGDRCLEHEAEPVLEGVKYGEIFLFEYYELDCRSLTISSPVPRRRSHSPDFQYFFSFPPIVEWLTVLRTDIVYGIIV